MSFLAGETITAARLNRLQPKVTHVAGTANLAASQTTTLIPGLTTSVTTETAGAQYSVTVCVAFYASGGVPGGSASFRLFVDGAGVGVFGIVQEAASTDKAMAVQTYVGTISTPGAHTVEVRATTPTNMIVTGVYSTMLITVTEVA